ncbi:MAG: NfeD family protein [Pseudomonadota bacterium]
MTAVFATWWLPRSGSASSVCANRTGAFIGSHNVTVAATATATAAAADTAADTAGKELEQNKAAAKPSGSAPEGVPVSAKVRSSTGSAKAGTSAQEEPPLHVPAEEPPGPRPLPSIPSEGPVTMVEVHGTIDLGVAPYIIRILENQRAGELVVLDINTLGGRIDAAIEIRDALLRASGRTVCWINPRAISAGALIALACDVIAVSPGGTIGAATPVQIGKEGMEPVEEKVVSYMRKEMRSTAEAKGRRGDIAEAMVDADVEIPGLDEKGKLLTLDSNEALSWGYAEIKAANEAELFDRLGRATTPPMQRPKLSWAERIARFISDPTVSSLLMTLGILGILIEFYAPGHLVSAAAGVSLLAIFFFGPHVVKLAGWEEILLFAVGVVLIVVEVTVPGHIVPGILGALAVLGALTLSLVNLKTVPIEVAWKAGWVTGALTKVLGSIFFSGLAMLVMCRFLPESAFGRRIVLSSAIRGAATSAINSQLASHVGAQAIAATDLHPAGKVLVEGDRRVEAVAERGYVARGRKVLVLRADGNRLVVREIETEGGGSQS